MSRVKSVSSPLLLLVFLIVSMALAAPIIELAEETIVTAAGFYVRSTDEVGPGPLVRYRFMASCVVTRRVILSAIALACPEGARRCPRVK